MLLSVLQSGSLLQEAPAVVPSLQVHSIYTRTLTSALQYPSMAAVPRLNWLNDVSSFATTSLIFQQALVPIIFAIAGVIEKSLQLQGQVMLASLG